MAATGERRHRVRHTASVVLIVLVAILTPLVVTAGWAVTTITDTNRFVSTMSALGTNRTVTNYLAAEGAATIVVDLDVQQRVEKALPASSKLLAPFITNLVQQQLTKVLSTVLASQQFQRIWTDKVRLLHAAFVTAMTTNESKVSQAAKLGLDVTPQLLQAITTLDQHNIHVLDPARKYLLNDKSFLVTIAEGKQFHEVQWYFHVATTLRWVLWVVTLVLAAAAVLIDSKRRRAGLWLGIGVACSCVVMLALLAIGKQYAISHSPTPPDVANVVFSTLTSWLRWELRVVVLIGLLAAFILWLTGPSRSARGLRRLFARGGDKAGHAVEGMIGAHASGRIEADSSTAVDWVARYATLLAWLGVVLGAILLAAWADSFLSAVVVILLTIAWFAGVTAIRRRVQGAATPLPGATPPAGTAAPAATVAPPPVDAPPTGS